MTLLIALEHATARFVKAAKAVQTMREAGDDFTATQQAWSDFIIAIAGIYSKLEQGVKGDGRASAWFGTVRKERRDNPILCYLQHARNADEHTLEETTAVNFSINISGDDIGKFAGFVSLASDGSSFMQRDTGEKVKATSYPMRVVVGGVRDRGQYYAPPTFLNGQETFQVSPLDMAEPALAAVQKMITDAAAFLPCR